MTITRVRGRSKPIKGGTSVFKAKYKGTCPVCDLEIEVGQAIYIDKKTSKAKHGYMKDCLKKGLR